MFVIGIDENGLGPLLGPLVVTAAAFEAPSYNPKDFWTIADELLPAKDSKKMFSVGRLGKAEKATLAWLDAFGHRPSTHANLVSSICSSTSLPLPCGEFAPARCRPSSVGLPLFSDSSSERRNFASRGPLSFRGIIPTAVQSVSVCPGAFNRAMQDRDMNKFKLDFRLMMKLAGNLSSGRGESALVLCGKVGSTRSYVKWLEESGYRVAGIGEETAQMSSYEVAEIGRLNFIRDADASHLPVAVASMIGKYLRELAVEELNRLLAEPGMRRASGYRDRVTSDFVARTEKRRVEIGLDNDCFCRKS